MLAGGLAAATKELTGSILRQNDRVHERVHRRRLRLQTSPEPAFQPVPKRTQRFSIAGPYASERNRQSRSEYRTEKQRVLRC